MSESNCIALLEEIRRLMELKAENPFKIRAFERASHSLAGCKDLTERAKAGTLTELDGIGKGISEVLTEFLLKGTSKVRDELLASLPAGLIELTEIPGLGPKKAMQLIEDLEIHSVSELEYACRENRLLKLKGFGEKIQHKILEGIQFMKSTQGQQRLGDAFDSAELLLKQLVEAAGARVSETGALRRRMEILSELEFLVEAPEEKAKAAKQREKLETRVKKYKEENSGSLPVKLHYCSGGVFGYELARTTGSEKHWQALGAPGPEDCPEETDFYDSRKLSWIPPETRETGEEVKLSRAGELESLLPWDGVRGIFHNHTTRSDGAASVEEMVLAAQKLGYEYIGISDHSQSAFYAQGLKKDSLLSQEREIRDLQEKHPGIRIFWGIESDILADGSLDYEPAVLKRFDFVIASVHSRFQMEKEAMTDRLIEAIHNPYTRFLGHATGRLLLGRKGYDLHMDKVIKEAAKHDVAIEFNANPARLDIDWRWGPELRAARTPVSINPDAHDVEGLTHTRYGIAMARKALIPTDLVVNARSAQEVEKWLKRA